MTKEVHGKIIIKPWSNLGYDRRVFVNKTLHGVIVKSDFPPGWRDSEEWKVYRTDMEAAKALLVRMGVLFDE